jgi:glucose/arabinose dehydrogenase
MICLAFAGEQTCDEAVEMSQPLKPRDPHMRTDQPVPTATRIGQRKSAMAANSKPPRTRAIVAFAALVLTSAGDWVRADSARDPLPLPTPPPGTRVRVVASFDSGDQEPVRIAAHPATGRLYVLGGGGDVSLLNGESGTKSRVLSGRDYIERPRHQNLNIPLPVDAKVVNSPITLRATLCLGLTFDRDGRLYIVANIQIPGKVYINRVVIYRTTRLEGNSLPSAPAAWTRFDYPYGVGGFNHGAGRIAQGPDGMIYLGSGSRTDHGEPGNEPNVSKAGEAPDPEVPGGPGGMPSGELTACILRFDPARGQQPPEIFSRGNRNPFGFDWDDRGRLIDAEHGPMADHPEELNHIERGKHYGFPYVFGNGETPAYPDSPRAPDGVKFEAPLENKGPAGLLGVNPLYSLAPHSAPGGLLFYRTGKLPGRYENSFFLARFGNLVNYNRIGFDVLNFRIEEDAGALVVHAERFLDNLARPIDLAQAGGKLYIVEYCRQTETVGPASAGYGAGGRVLEVSSDR